LALIDPVNIVFAALCLIVFVVSERTWRKMKKATLAKLKEEMFPQLIDNLKALDKRLSEEEIVDEDYVELLGRGWKQSLHLDFLRYFSHEETIYISLKQDLEEYPEYVGEWKKTGDERLKEKIAEKKTQIRKKLTKLIETIDEIKRHP